HVWDPKLGSLPGITDNTADSGAGERRQEAAALHLPACRGAQAGREGAAGAAGHPEPAERPRPLSSRSSPAGCARREPPAMSTVAAATCDAKGAGEPGAEKKPLKPCCACPETKKARDACIIEKGEENCGHLIEAHKECMRALGFKI
uniref:Cytochrome c oxidase copper chaperone n=2 Tax=Strigops habroptila TaxID=2489341 RepID=A0A672U8Q2_STRHB